MHVYVHSHTCAHINVIRFSGKIPIKDFLVGLNKRNSVVRVFMSLTDSAFLKSVLFKKKRLPKGSSIDVRKSIELSA